MKYCKKCIQPDTRPNIKFDEEGICGACRYEESKSTIDWTAREAELKEIAEWAKANTSCAYDCVIGISGGKDSFWQVYYAKNILGLNPLCVCNAPDGRTAVGTHNIENLRTKLDIDLIEVRPSPNVMKWLTKKDFFKHSNIVKSSEYSLWSSAYRIAVEKKIPLVIQGENPALIFGLSDNVSGGDSLTIRNNNTINGCNADDLVITEEEAKLYKCNTVKRNQLEMFQMPSFEGINIKGIFLQYYDKNWGQVHNTRFSRSFGLLGRYSEKLEDIGRTFRETSVDGDGLLVNQWLKYLKFAFGYEMDSQCYNIREIGVSREEALMFIKMYDHCIGEQYIDDFCNYIEISKSDFYKHVCDNIVNKKLFDVEYRGDLRPIIKPKFTVGVDFEEQSVL
jgi:N-acetyl sugar amidotransferase